MAVRVAARFGPVEIEGPRGRPSHARHKDSPWRGIAAIVVGVWIGLPRAAAGQYGLVTLPMTDPAYVQLAALERAGCAAARVSIARPYEVRLVRVALLAARAQPHCAGPILAALQSRFAPRAADSAAGLRAGAAATLKTTAYHNGVFAPLWENVRPASDGDQPAVGTLHGRLTWGDGDKVAIVADGYAVTGIRNDPTIREDVFRHTSGVVDASEAYISVRAGVFTVTVGRGPEAWLGSGTESTILSANGPPLDRIAAAFHTAHFEGRAFFGVLSDVVLDSLRDSVTSSIGPQRYYRYLAGHVLSWKPSRFLELTAGETALIATGSPTFDLTYINPVIPYQIARHDTGRSGLDAGDLTAFAAVRTRIGPATAAAELLVDDLQIDALGRRRDPDQLAYELSVSVPVPISVPATLTADYRRADSYTYLDVHYTNVFQSYNQPLGSALGPDADYGMVAADVFPLAWLRLSGDVGVWRRGLQRIDERPGQSPNGHAGDPFPTSTVNRPVQSAAIADASIEFLNVVLPITARIQLARIRDANNAPVGAANYAQAQLVATYAFRYP